MSSGLAGFIRGKSLMANIDGQWSAAPDKQMQTEAQSARPLKQPGSAVRQRFVQAQLVVLLRQACEA
jgi:hypothetical protein